MPTWSDKLLQEVIRLILEAYYEPQFSDTSHGFRPGRGCQTALRETEHWPGTTWFIEGDIKACFDSLDHKVMLDILAMNIYDKRFLNLIRRLFQAGYMEEWRYHTTYSGAPQGGIVSPILSNIYLDRLDKSVEHVLKPAYTYGDRRKISKPYMKLIHKAAELRKAGRHKEAQEVRRKAQQMPSVNTTDPNFKRLKYVRYADDWIIGYVGPKEEAEEIKRKVKGYLHDVLKLELSEEKTLITHARTQAARFLSYEIAIAQKNTYQTHGDRSVNGRIVLRIPSDVLDKKCQVYTESEKPKHRKELINDTPYSIMMRYQAELRGFAEYYQLALNAHKLWRLKWIMEISLTKTLATKLKTTVSKVRKKYQAIHTVNGVQYKGLAVIVPRKDKKPLIAKWGGIPFRRTTKAILADQLPPTWPGRSELEKRLLADICELCGSKEQITIHHIRALKDVQMKGRREKPLWMHVMAARRRKTLVVCWSCHMSIQHGRPLKLAKEVK